ncbi:hypothetical protein EJ06DRAFT_141478 [Trichodelitschia bisporula]|uniref:Copper-fist domain-containing protein n=1 Tax=Trichodelitschia bisporula TaxID=703511 RepID=A0A6G1HPL9_9PEZI|nr:hypothetical protein EJ06DRAFT_141478 [Trichodelitschia bisporula]
MPEVIINGEKKKVACGPCIRGHRSSKCAHKDRVLIEVRKPGRPLSACPHPVGSCSCERVIINYTIPKASECPCPTEPGSTPAVATSTSRVQKPRPKRSVSGVTPSTVQKALEDPLALAQHVTQRAEASSDSSSTVPSVTSSNNSTPRIDALDTGRQPTNGHSREWTGTFSPETALTGTTGTPSFCAPRSCCAPSEASPQTPLKSEGFDVPDQLDLNAGQFRFNMAGVPFPGVALDMFGYATVGTEDRMGCAAHVGVPGGLPPPGHNCQCGDSCSCLGCAMHPGNKTTTEYVRYHNELAMRSGYYNVTPFLDQTQYGQMGQPQLSQMDQIGQQMGHPQVGQPLTMPFHPPGYPNGYSQQPFMPPPMPQWQMSPPPPRDELAAFHFSPTTQQMQFPFTADFAATPQSTFGQSLAPVPAPAPVLAQAPAPRKPACQNSSSMGERPIPEEAASPEEDTASTLSPSSFYLQQFTLPGCDDVTGSCQCGDGCKCAGCLTHSGHDGNVAESSAQLVQEPAAGGSCCGGGGGYEEF